MLKEQELREQLGREQISAMEQGRCAELSGNISSIRWQH
jgi:hypothetical protein